jgi:hypothetical protein
VLFSPSMSAPSIVSATVTPILDRQSPMPPPVKAAGGSARTILIWFLLAFGATILFSFWHPPLVSVAGRHMRVEVDQFLAGGSLLPFLVLLPLAVLATVYSAILIHELGHIVGGILVGFRFSSLRVSRIQIDRPFKVSLYRGKNAGAGGWARMFPTKTDHLAWRALVMIAAGPAANLLTVSVLLLFPAGGPLLAWFFTSSLIIGLINLLPFRSGAYHTDGSRIVMLLMNRARGERWVAMLKLSAELREGVMPEALSPSYLAKAVALRDKSPDTVAAHVLAYSTAFHQHKDDEAAAMLEVCLQFANYTSPLIRASLMSDAAVFQARRRCDLVLAQEWLAATPESREIPWLKTRAEAAILQTQGNIAAALAKLDEAEKMMSENTNEARREMSLRFLRRWQAELKMQRATSA